MKYHLENITYVEFFNELNQLRDLISKEKVSLENPKQKILSFLKKTIKPNVDLFDSFLESYFYSKCDLFIPNLEADFSEIEISNFISHFNKLIDYFSIIDNFDKPAEIIQLESVTEKSDFLLAKLNKLFNDNFYSVSIIFDLNDINYRANEPREIAENLNKRGYLQLEKDYGNSDNSKLSIKGANYVERKNKSKNKEENNSKKDSELDQKLNQIIDYLSTLGLGQEIIFEEIEELRDLQTKLSKKTWTQLLKGKLFDLALDQVLNREAANHIFEFLSNSTKKILR